ncbi:MAG: hypothetical protein H0T56_12740 [Pseudaminobacter sp.]|nr:hypothetical protein [Pseudaminobacter sp.]
MDRARRPSRTPAQGIVAVEEAHIALQVSGKFAGVEAGAAGAAAGPCEKYRKP